MDSVNNIDSIIQNLKQLPTLKICISGDLGSGKSELRKYLQSKLDLKSYSTGDFQRELAAKKSMTTLELNQYAEIHPEIDHEIDAMSEKLGRRETKFIIDSRLAWNFIPDSFKIYLSVETDIAARRIFEAGRNNEAYASLEEARNAIISRRGSEMIRYKEFYQVNLTDHQNYDLVVNTSHHPITEIGENLLVSIDQWSRATLTSNRLFFT